VNSSADKPCSSEVDMLLHINIQLQFIINFQLMSLLSISRYIRFEVFTAMTMKNGVFCDVTQCGSCKNLRF
jgi:hypothetical protein